MLPAVELQQSPKQRRLELRNSLAALRAFLSSSGFGFWLHGPKRRNCFSCLVQGGGLLATHRRGPNASARCRRTVRGAEPNAHKRIFHSGPFCRRLGGSKRIGVFSQNFMCWRIANKKGGKQRATRRAEAKPNNSPMREMKGLSRIGWI